MINTDLNIIYSFFTSLLITYFAIPKVIFFAEKYRLSDKPIERSAHKVRIPVFGGIAIFSGVIFSLLFWAKLDSIQFILVSLFVVFFVGVIDDLLSLTPFKKLIGQIIAILIVIYFGDMRIDSMHGVLGVRELPHFASTLFTIFVVVVIINSFNLIDGVDGLASGVGCISSLSFGLLALLMKQYDIAIIAFSLLGSLLGFLKYNFYPARIFMGDSGSLVIGMILSILAINIISVGLVYESYGLPNKGPFIAIVFLALPLFDTLRVFVVRVMKGKNPLLAGREHIHHALLDLEFGHKKTALILYLLSLILIFVSYFFLQLNVNWCITILALISFSILILPYFFLKSKK